MINGGMLNMKSEGVMLKHKWLRDDKNHIVYLTKNIKTNKLTVKNMLDITKEFTQIFTRQEIEDFKVNLKTDFSDFIEIEVNIEK